MDITASVKAASDIILNPKLLAFIAAFSGVALFAPETFIATLGLDSLRGEFRPWLGLAFLASAVFLLLHGAAWYTTKMRRKVALRRLERDRLDWICQLSGEERAALRWYIRHDTQTQLFAMDSGLAGGLEAKKFLFRSSSMGNIIDGFPYNVQPWVWQKLTEEPELFGTQQEYDEDNRRDEESARRGVGFRL